MDVFDAGLRSHCQRVAAWSHELAGDLRMTGEESQLLEQAALLHHLPLEMLEKETVNRLCGELWPAGQTQSQIRPALGVPAQVGIPAKVQQILEAMRHPDNSQRTDRISALAGILELADVFDEQLELAQFEGHAIQQMLETTPDDPVIGAVLASLRKATRADLLPLIPRLPVYPAIAMKALAVLGKPELHLREVEQISAMDQVLAGQLLQAANSAFFSPRYPLKTVKDAINFIGLEETRRVLAAAALRPLFSAPKMKQLWQHSIETAQVAERIAGMSDRVSPREAFLAGLVHDIGRLAISLLPAEVSAVCERLTGKGCETTVAEVVLLGFDHAEAGADVLEIWKFPRDMVQAVRHHHSPDWTDSDLAALLYVTEFWSAAEEDLPSNSVLRSALRRLGISAEDLGTADLASASAVQVLA